MVLNKHKLIQEVPPSMQNTYKDINPSAWAGIQPWVEYNYHITRQSGSAQIRARSEKKSVKFRLHKTMQPAKLVRRPISVLTSKKGQVAHFHQKP